MTAATKSYLLLSTVFTIILISCACGGSNGQSGQSASLRIVQANPALGGSDVLIDGSVVSSKLPFAANTDYLSLTSGTHALTLRYSGTTVFTGSVIVRGDSSGALAANSKNTFFFGGWGPFGDGGGVVSFADDTTPVSSKVELRLISAAYASFPPTFDVYVLPPGAVPNGSPTFSNLQFLTLDTDTYIVISPGAYEIFFTTTGTTTTVYQAGTVDFSANQNRTFVLANNCSASSCDYQTFTSFILADLN